MLDKLKWIYRFARARTFVLLLDKQAVVHIPLMDIDSFESQFMLSAQTASLQEFKSRLEDLISEHEQAIQLLSHRESVKQATKAKTRDRTNVQKVTKKK